MLVNATHQWARIGVKQKTRTRKELRMPCHPLERLQQRYNKDFTRNDLSKIRKLILTGKHVLLQVLAQSSCFYLVKYDHIPMKILYNHDSARVITAYPLDVDECNQYLNLLE